MQLKSILIPLTFILFLVQFKFYDEWNSKLNQLELAGIRYSTAINGVRLNKILFQKNPNNKNFLTNSASELTNSLVGVMTVLKLGQEEQKSFLEILKKYENNQLNSFSTYEKFEADFNLTRDRFIEEHYNPKVARLKNFKNVSGYLIIILTFFLALLNLAKERKDTIKH